MERKIGNETLVKAAADGDLETVNNLLLPNNMETYNISQFDFNNAMLAAAMMGNVNIVKILIDAGATFTYPAAQLATKYNKIEVVELLAQQLIFDNNILACNYLMAYAARKGRKEIVQKLAITYATDYDLALIQAAKKGNKDIVKMMLDLGITDYDSAQYHASRAGYFDICKLINSYEKSSL